LEIKTWYDRQQKVWVVEAQTRSGDTVDAEKASTIFSMLKLERDMREKYLGGDDVDGDEHH
jgi:hypothetical protein